MTKLLDKLITPIRSYPLSDSDFKAKYNRNKFQFFSIQTINLMSIALYVSDAANRDLHRVSLIMALTIDIVFLLSCRSKFWLFRLWYAFCLTVYAPIMIDFPDGIYYATLSVVFCPLFILATTERQIHAGVSLLIGLYYFWTTITLKITQRFSGCINEDEIKNIAIAVIFFVLIMYILVGVHDYNYKKTLKKLAEARVIEDAYSHQNNFLLSLSHELRNPLNCMIGSIQLALFDNLSKETRENLDNAQVAGEVLLQFINNILDGGKIESGGLEIRHDSVDICKLLEKVWVISSKLMKNKGLKGSVSVSKKIPSYINSDFHRLTQILLNLFGNAIKFTSSGLISASLDWIPDRTQIDDLCFEPLPFVKATINEEGIFEKNKMLMTHDKDNFVSLFTNTFKFPKFERISNHNCNGVLRITVSDSGCGIEPTDIPKLFKKFTQVNQEISNRQVGTGLGLYIAKEICKKMKGDIRAYSQKGKGAVFVVCIPTQAIPRQEQSMSIHSSHIFPQSQDLINLARDPKAMIVDDDAFNLKILSSFIQKLQINDIGLAKNGLEACALYKSSVAQGKPFNIITMDYDMPEMNGKDAVMNIREFEREKNLKPALVIMISGHCSATIIEECTSQTGKIKANYFLKKPVNFEHISELIKHQF